MHLSTKANFDNARAHWTAFWNHDVVKRPCVGITGPRANVTPKPDPAYMAEAREDPAAVAQAQLDHVRSRFWLGDAIPFRYPSFGPDVFAGFMGSDLAHSSDPTLTSWAVPFVDSWPESFPLHVDPENATLQKMLSVIETFAQVGEGHFLVGMLDLHSNLDALVAIRGVERLLIDLVECPETIDEAMRQVRELYPSVYETCYRAGNMDRWGTIGWWHCYCAGRFAMVQCDTICMLSQEHFRRFVLPAIEEETAFLDHSFFHLDGPDALRHLDDLLAIETLDGIQWEPGAGQPWLPEWLDLLKRIQQAGKSVCIYAENPERLKMYHRELRPELVCYSVSAETEEDARRLLDWLEANT